MNCDNCGQYVTRPIRVPDIQHDPVSKQYAMRVSYFCEDCAEQTIKH